MIELDDLRDRLQEVSQQLACLGHEEDAWRAAMDASEGHEARARLAMEGFLSRRTERRRSLNAELAHLIVLLNLHEYEYGSPNYEPGSEPAFALSLDQLIQRLTAWLVQLTRAHRFRTYLQDGQRLTLAWCAQLLASQAPYSQTPAFSDDFLEAARSIYAVALNPKIAHPTPFSGRHLPDAQLMLAFASFPFLEGFSRRRLADFVDTDGSVLQEFQVCNARHRYSPGGRISNLAHTLHLLEEVNATEPLGRTLANIRNQAGTYTVPGKADPVGLYELIFYHRNLNLHGGDQLASVGLAALILATIIGLETVRADFDTLSEISRAVTKDQSPLDPSGVWPHWVFYPVDFEDAHDPMDIHHWNC